MSFLCLSVETCQAATNPVQFVMLKESDIAAAQPAKNVPTLKIAYISRQHYASSKC